MSDRRFIPGTSSPVVPAEPLPPMRWPSWMDAQYQLQASERNWTVYTMSGLGDIKAHPGNSRRWGILFLPTVSGASSLTITPDGVPDTFGWGFGLNSIPLLLTIFQFGPIVGLPFRLVPGGGASIAVCDLILQ